MKFPFLVLSLLCLCSCAVSPLQFEEVAQRSKQITQAQYKLGQSSLEKQDYQSALAWFNNAAKRGHAGAMSMLGYLYTHGLGVKQNHFKALQWSKRAAQKNNALAMYNLGTHYFNGYGVEKNLQLALNWIQSAASLGLAKAQYKLGGLYHAGNVNDKNSREQNLQQAIYWYQKAALQSYADARVALIRLYLNNRTLDPDFEKSEYWLSLSQRGHSIHIAQQYFYGTGVTQNYEIAKSHYEKAASHGSVEAKAMLAHIYFEGLGVKQDRSKAMALLKEAAKGGHVLSQTTLARAHLLGMYIEQNDTEAIRWYTEAALAGEAASQWALGEIYLSGQVAHADYSQAIYWLEHAAQQQHYQAQFSLARLYLAGKKQNMTPTQAFDWTVNMFHTRIFKSKGDDNAASLHQILEQYYNLIVLLANNVDNLTVPEPIMHRLIEQFQHYAERLPKAPKRIYRIIERQLRNISDYQPLSQTCDITIEVLTDSQRTNLDSYYRNALSLFLPFKLDNVCVNVKYVAQPLLNCASQLCITTGLYEKYGTDIRIYASRYFYYEDSLAYAIQNRAQIFSNELPSASTLHHELMHMFHFDDEYALNEDRAKTQCHVNQRSANIVYIESDSQLPKEKRFKANTCNNASNITAYKQEAHNTIMDTNSLYLPRKYIRHVRDTRTQSLFDKHQARSVDKWLIKNKLYFLEKHWNDKTRLFRVHFDVSDEQYADQDIAHVIKHDPLKALQIADKYVAKVFRPMFFSTQQPQDYNKKAIFILTELAEQGLALAQYYLACFLEVRGDYELAKLWYARAAEQGFLNAKERIERLMTQDIDSFLDDIED
ncbi:sel1 repeat family protein [Pseudoalteromonas sp. JBTF-M23]|uniref:Sel1 repeat family protein n=1 Tax=Pseudoalteromonas caenipelagi TaxID=2726988 RepID=A0A849V8V5_9GAMM|nr:tetratricopeptide repeat protein [Pseudoalteromonas caenipelagi]NOU49762.1 sel1 repeat family protein [Pseudoalteromonas caenipelagi]